MSIEEDRDRLRLPSYITLSLSLGLFRSTSFLSYLNVLILHTLTSTGDFEILELLWVPQRAVRERGTGMRRRDTRLE